MIVVMSAVREEIAGVKKRIEAERENVRGAWSVGKPRVFPGKFAGVPILLVQTGVGKEKVRAAVEAIRECDPLQAMIFLGFGGALAQELKVGDLVLCQKMILGTPGEAAGSCDADSDLVILAEQALHNMPVKYTTGSSLTVRDIVTDPGEKEALGRQTGALVAEMENYWIARIAQDDGIPFLAVRSISDTASESLPPFDHFASPAGSIQWSEVWRYFRLHPARFFAIPRFYISTRRARESLTRFCLALIPLLTDHPHFVGKANSSSDPGSDAKLPVPATDAIRSIEGEMTTYGSSTGE